ncbi:hypothetical protein B0T17DRAFT_506566 [Bombardia bombarda]|uniref:Uncharacterized protein n=1 Tax=Bombardia bombarda TaxID=252184 RepID=A0AA40C964_9PEZI|nr:hypothetical protein B0T17DRAFT_506566 [Bombardia bombarda]
MASYHFVSLLLLLLVVVYSRLVRWTFLLAATSPSVRLASMQPEDGVVRDACLVCGRWTSVYWSPGTLPKAACSHGVKDNNAKPHVVIGTQHLDSSMPEVWRMEVHLGVGGGST